MNGFIKPFLLLLHSKYVAAWAFWHAVCACMAQTACHVLFNPFAGASHPLNLIAQPPETAANCGGYCVSPGGVVARAGHIYAGFRNAFLDFQGSAAVGRPKRRHIAAVAVSRRAALPLTPDVFVRASAVFADLRLFVCKNTAKSGGNFLPPLFVFWLLDKFTGFFSFCR